MKKNNKKNFLLGLGLLSVLCLTGCGNKQQPAQAEPNEGAETGTQSNNYSKADWIKDLGVKFGYMTADDETPLFSDVSEQQDYYQEVQACAEWGVITETDKFNPANAVSWEYALNTSVRAIGLNDLNEAGYEISEEDSLTDFYLNNIAAVDIADLSESITEEEAVQVLNYASDFENNLEFPEIKEMSYQEGVVEVSEQDILLRVDGESADIVGDKTFEAGQVLVYTNTENGDIEAVKVESVEENLLRYTQAGIDDVYESLRIRGMFDSDVDFSSARPVEPQVLPVNVALYNASQQGRIESLIKDSHLQSDYSIYDTKVQVTTNGSSFTVSDPEKNWKVDVGIKNIKASADIDYSLFKLKKADLNVNYDTYIHGEMKQEHVGNTIPLGSVKVSLYGVVSAELNLVLNLGAEGEATLDYSSHVVASAGYQNGKGLQSKIENQNVALDFHAEVTLSAEPCAKLSLKVLHEEIVNAKVTSGLVAIAKVDADLLGKLPTCVDIHLYVPLRWAVNEDSCLATKVFKNKAKASAVVWDATHSNFEWDWHFEDFVEVDECTRGKEEEVKAPVVDENGEPFDEEEKFEFQPIDFATIKLESSMMFLTKDETLKIGFKEVPQGQSTDTFVYEVVDNQGICQPNGNGTITGLTPGAANIKISTADGLYHAYITVVVQDDYTTEFNPL